MVFLFGLGFQGPLVSRGGGPAFVTSGAAGPGAGRGRSRGAAWVGPQPAAARRPLHSPGAAPAGQDDVRGDADH